MSDRAATVIVAPTVNAFVEKIVASCFGVGKIALARDSPVVSRNSSALKLAPASFRAIPPPSTTTRERRDIRSRLRVR